MRSQATDPAERLFDVGWAKLLPADIQALGEAMASWASAIESREEVV